MTSTRSKIVKITQKTTASQLSKAQKLFNRLIKKIDGQRKQLLAWQINTQLYHQKHSAEYIPLVETLDQHRTQLVYLFDRAYHEKIFSKTDREKLEYLISLIAGELLIDNDTEELKSIFNRYNETDFDTQGEELDASVITVLEDMFGVKIDDDVNPNDPEAVLKFMAEKMQETHAEETRAQQTFGGNRKKSAKQLANEARKEAEEKSLSQSIREVYRKLASALHPDREQDPAERTRKTNLMQRVNVAYDKNDLLQMLELQLEVEQIDQSMINNISEERLKHYNRILAEQSSELGYEIEQNALPFRLHFQRNRGGALSPASLIPELEDDIRQLKNDIKSIIRDLRDFEQPKKIKAWLKTYHIPQSSPFGDDDFERLFTKV